MAKLPELKTRFPEPVVDSGADPYVVTHGEYFYYCHVINDQAIYIRKAKTLDAIGKAETVQVWPSPGESLSENLWAPELHLLDGKWYVYYTDGPKIDHDVQQRSYVIEGDGDDPQTATYTFKGKVATPSDERSIDGTILNMDDGQRYFVWSGWESPENEIQHLYIAKMANPWTLIGERIKIASPVFEWESHRIGVNEGPQVLPQGTKRHIIYSASHGMTNHYCLGQLTLVGSDPLDPTHWIKRPNPIYESQKGLISPGHASFILTEDEKYGWMIFHTARHADAGFDRQVRLAAFEVTEDGNLNFMPTTRLFEQVGEKLSLVRLWAKLVGRR